MPTPDPSTFSELTRLSVKTPDSLAQAAGIDPKANAFGLYYAASEAWATDGYNDHGLSYEGVYDPIMTHPMIADTAACRNFSSEEREPKDLLVFEVGGWVYFGPFGIAQSALRKTNEHVLETGQEREGMVESERNDSLNTLRQTGGLESISGATPENEAHGVCAIRELDAQVTWETIKGLTNCDGYGTEAMKALLYANENAERLGLDPNRVREAKEEYAQKLIAILSIGDDV